MLEKIPTNRIDIWEVNNQLKKFSNDIFEGKFYEFKNYVNDK